jgi:hypothetical protein
MKDSIKIRVEIIHNYLPGKTYLDHPYRQEAKVSKGQIKEVHLILIKIKHTRLIRNNYLKKNVVFSVNLLLFKKK